MAGLPEAIPRLSKNLLGHGELHYNPGKRLHSRFHISKIWWLWPWPKCFEGADDYQLLMVQGQPRPKSIPFSSSPTQPPVTIQSPEQSKIPQGGSKHRQVLSTKACWSGWTSPPGQSHLPGRLTQAWKLLEKCRQFLSDELRVWAGNSGRSLSTGAQQTLRPGNVSIRAPAYTLNPLIPGSTETLSISLLFFWPTASKLQSPGGQDWILLQILHRPDTQHPSLRIDT